MSSEFEVNQKRLYVEGLLKVEPGMANNDLNAMVVKKFGSGINGTIIDQIRETLGYRFEGRGRGRKLVKIQPGTPVIGAEPATTTTTQVATATATPPAQTTTVTQRAAEGSVRAQTAQEQADDAQLLTDLISRIQGVMERQGMVYLEIPGRGNATVHRKTVVTETIGGAGATQTTGQGVQAAAQAH